MAPPLTTAVRRALAVAAATCVGVVVVAVVLSRRRGSQPEVQSPIQAAVPTTDCGDVVLGSEGEAVLECSRDACSNNTAIAECQAVKEEVEKQCAPFKRASRWPTGFSEQLLRRGAAVAVAMREGGFTAAADFGKCVKKQASPIVDLGSRRPRALTALVAALLIFGGREKPVPLPDCQELREDVETGNLIHCYLDSCASTRDHGECARELEDNIKQCRGKEVKSSDAAELIAYVRSLTQEHMEQQKAEERGAPNTGRESPLLPGKRTNPTFFLRPLPRPRQIRRSSDGGYISDNVALVMELINKALFWDKDTREVEDWAVDMKKFSTCLEEMQDSGAISALESYLEGEGSAYTMLHDNQTIIGAAALPALSARAGLIGLAVATVAALALSLAAALRPGSARDVAAGGMELSLDVEHA